MQFFVIFVPNKHNRNSEMAYKILIADDEPDILEFVSYNLAKEGYEVFTAADGAEAVEVAAQKRPHLILLDRMMPIMDGLQVCRLLRAKPETARTHIVFLSALGEEENQLSGFRAGADDYIPKPIKMNILKSRINAIMRRLDEFEPTPAPAPAAPAPGAFELDSERHILRHGSSEIALPRKEFMLFSLLYSSGGRLVTREEIYEKVWGSEVIVGKRTIDVHIRRLRRKIGDQHILTVKGLGYKFIN